MPPSDPIQKAAQLLLRLVAAGLILIGGLMAALEVLAHRAKQTEVNFLQVAAFGLLFLAGVLLFAASRKLAARFTGNDANDAGPAAPDE